MRAEIECVDVWPTSSTLLSDDNPTVAVAEARCLKKPACAHAQPVMPGRQPSRVHRKARLTGQTASKSFAASEHRSAFGAKADRFTQFFEMPGLELFAAVQVGGEIARHETGLLQSKLSRARECRRCVGHKGNVAERENRLLGHGLQSWMNFD